MAEEINLLIIFVVCCGEGEEEFRETIRDESVSNDVLVKQKIHIVDILITKKNHVHFPPMYAFPSHLVILDD